MNDGWRMKIGKKRKSNELDWRIYLQKEYVDFVDEVLYLSQIYDWSFWGGGNGNYAITLCQNIVHGLYISIKLNASDNYKYYASFESAYNPNNVLNSSYVEYIGSNKEEALKFIKKYFDDNQYESTFERNVIMGNAYDTYILNKLLAMEEI